MSAVKLFVDDIREAPEGWVRASTITEAIRILATRDVSEVSLDHDIAYQDERGKFTGKLHNEDFTSVAWFIREMSAQVKPEVVYVHSSNPVAMARIGSILCGCVKVEQVDWYRHEWNEIEGKRKDMDNDVA